MLTDIRCRSAKPKDKPYKLADAHGLYLYVTTSGFRSWRLKYRFDGKEHRLTFGPYPDISLADAREARDEARKLLRAGTDPKLVRKVEAARRNVARQNSFESLAREWQKQQAAVLAPRYAGQILDRMEADVFPSIGSLPISAITPALVLTLVRGIEARGALEMAKRVRQHISAVYIYAIGAGLADTDPAAIIQSAMMPATKRLRPAMVKLEDARAMLAKIEAEEGAYTVTKLASRLLALTAVRPGVLRLAQRSEFEDLGGAAPLWRIPAEKMKLTRERKQDASFELVVPLSEQAVETVAAARQLSADKPYLFPSTRYANQPITDSTLSKLYRTAGFSGQHVPHGWRSTFSTVMNQIAATEGRKDDREIIDMMLAHIKGDVEAIYNRYAYMPRRRELAQEWADVLMKNMPPAVSLLPAQGQEHDRQRIRRDRAGPGLQKQAQSAD
ncbi:integrase arm-type DNA-binding domain-containing protein [Sphingobium sufflavum]|uniref:tyrosine-type recombinase/integrase n=1 Tax=Sphingobium sufflavum TaxID=1129547 RepID=UPI001F2008C7|nr:integrase arm-type DNA-binding domain-containing protein [Sphingobium sufflavum]MCE7798208.1 integrase arm-type DNA-binding domain-containing protein [Sphingobium sufflavum]